MRPTKITQSSLWAPLNWILATEGNIRVLRTLFLAEEPLSRARLADRTNLSLPGVSGALEKLQQSGIVEFVGTGSRQRIGIRAEHPLATSLRSLFVTEALRYQALIDELRELLNALPIQVLAAWLEEGGRNDPAPNAPVWMGVLVGSRDIALVNTSLQESVGAIQQRYDITLLVKAITRPDLETAEPDEKGVLTQVTPIVGPHPLSYLESSHEWHPSPAPEHRSHLAVDRRSLETARWVAERLDRDPTLPKRARSWIVHRMHQASSRETHELSEWLRLLEAASIPRIQYILLDSSERAARLRQSNPFIPVLSDEERRKLEEATRK